MARLWQGKYKKIYILTLRFQTIIWLKDIEKDNISKCFPSPPPPKGRIEYMVTKTKVIFLFHLYLKNVTIQLFNKFNF